MCNCNSSSGGIATAPCAQHPGGALERTRYYPRQLVGPDDLTQDQRYFLQKLRRHNRLLHGWGVVCGACVQRTGATAVTVEPGVVLSPWGDEIVIDREVRLDLAEMGLEDGAGCCPEEALDPWCKDTRPTCTAGTRYLAVRHRECDARPVRSTAGACGCGCSDDACEFTRVRDDFTFKLLAELPAGYTDPLREPSLMDLLPCRGGEPRACAPCPQEPWVVLADVRIDGSCAVVEVNCLRHRRHVVSFADFYLTCPERVSIGMHGVPAGHHAAADAARAMSVVTGGGMLVDVANSASGVPPRATVTLARPDGSPVTLPAHFNVRDGETLADFVGREGDRAFFDPADGAGISLRELLAASDADPDEELKGTLDVLALLEGRIIDPPAIRKARREVEALAGAEGLARLDEESLGRIGGAKLLTGDLLAREDPDSALGKALKAMNVEKIGALGRDEFVALVEAGLPEEDRPAARRRLGAVWESSSKLSDLARVEAPAKA